MQKPFKNIPEFTRERAENINPEILIITSSYKFWAEIVKLLVWPIPFKNCVSATMNGAVGTVYYGLFGAHRCIVYNSPKNSMRLVLGVGELLHTWKQIKAAFIVGQCWGTHPNQQQSGDIVVSDQVLDISYVHATTEGEFPLSGAVSINPNLVKIFQTDVYNSQKQGLYTVWRGLVLSGRYRPENISNLCIVGRDIESCHMSALNIPWIMVKSIIGFGYEDIDDEESRCDVDGVANYLNWVIFTAFDEISLKLGQISPVGRYAETGDFVPPNTGPITGEIYRHNNPVSSIGSAFGRSITGGNFYSNAPPLEYHYYMSPIQIKLPMSVHIKPPIPVQNPNPNPNPNPGSLKPASQSECPVCFEEKDTRVSNECGHVVCRDCYTLLVKNKKGCPVCRKPLVNPRPIFL